MKKEIFIGNVGIGGDHPVSVQSMTSTKTGDSRATLAQIKELYFAGCDIVRVSVPEKNVIDSFKKIVEESPLPVIADIHFSTSLAIESIIAGAKGLRINPGNIGSRDKLKSIVDTASIYGIPIRIGVNSGSIEKKYFDKNRSKAEMMVNSIMDKVEMFEELGFTNIKLSLKSSNVRETIEANRIIDKKCNYPIHLGVTEAGTLYSGTIKSSIGIGSLLADGIGNTIRVSLTDDPVKEVKVAKEILKVLGLRDEGVELISCPTCSRVSVDLISIVKNFEKRIEEEKISKNIKVAIMGCEVNGPGEAKDADIGIAFSQKKGFIFRKGKRIKETDPKNAISTLIDIIKNMP